MVQTKKGHTKIVNCTTPGAGVLLLGRGHISHIVKMHYSFKNPLLYSQAWMRQTKYMVIINKIVYFMTLGAGVLVLGCGHISQIVKMHFSF